MSFDQRSQYLAYIENREQIESSWDSNFGDRKTEIVFIGQNMNENLIRTQLDKCLTTVEELMSNKWKEGYNDEWPVERAYPVANF